MKTQKPKWQDTETLVRLVAESKFGATARAEDIAGVRCDGVIHLGDGSVVLLEVSNERSLKKLREDLAKFNALRPYFFQRNIFPKCFFVTSEEPTASLIESGKSNFVTVYSVWQFINAMLGVYDYVHRRNSAAFGSAVDLYSGQPDKNKYVQVSYFTDDGEPYSTDRIATELIRGRTIVLIGDYGAGKSRCIKEVFELLAHAYQQQYRNPIAINLRDNWGLKRASEIITRHFTDLGMLDQVGNMLKVAYSPSTVYLLDGFDEIGAQTWSDDPAKLSEIRQQSLVGVKDLIDRAQGGVLIAGREHYFNNDGELIKCLGVGKKSPLFLRCNQELTDQQFAEMLGSKAPTLPTWMPKKPLIAAVIRDIEPAAVDTILSTSSGQVDFWGLLIDTFCEREARINPILDAAVIRELYAHIGRLARQTESPVGPISIKQLNEAFERTIGRPPTDESAIILQRLPGLSRIGAESLDRRFVDTFILDGLKAEDVLSIYATSSSEQLAEVWRNPVEEFGALYIAASLLRTKQIGGAIAYLARHREAKNRILLSDLIAALFLVDCDGIDLGHMEFRGCRFSQISLSDTGVSNVQLSDCFFECLDLTDADPKDVTIKDSMVVRVAGVTSVTHMPDYLSNCLVEDFQNVRTLTAIRDAGLTTAQTFLLSSLRKLFLQPGGGRKESSMFKGFGDTGTKRICEKVIAVLVREKFCQKHRGTSEPLYVPDRSKTARVKAMMSQLTTSKDEVWALASRIS
jgi:energy-coupling factor transporter ATP-binding protein EcfA2